MMVKRGELLERYLGVGAGGTGTGLWQAHQLFVPIPGEKAGCAERAVEMASFLAVKMEAGSSSE